MNARNCSKTEHGIAACLIRLRTTSDDLLITVRYSYICHAELKCMHRIQ